MAQYLKQKHKKGENISKANIKNDYEKNKIK